MKKVRQWLTALVFVGVIFGGAVAHILLPDAAISREERRKLTQLPELSWNVFCTQQYSSELENYLLDQFPLRQELRSLNAVVRTGLLRQRDVNDYYLVQGSLIQMQTQLNEGQILYAADKIAWVYETYLQGMDAYYAVIPDKHYYGSQLTGNPSMDYDRMLELVRDNLPENIQSIDLFDVLTLEDYYTTDSHWRQECILPVANLLLSEMGAEVDAGLADEYEHHTLVPFYGVYYGQAALPVPSESLTYLTNNATEQSVVTSVEVEGDMPVYIEENFEGLDGYDVFLNGAQAVLTIQNPTVSNGKELIVFRDSFGSSIAPLLLNGYEKVTLIDLRYISSAVLDQYVEFDAERQDVLFLYNTTLLNSGRVLK